MKNIILVAVLSLFVFVACNNVQSGSHTHDDGTAHSECDHDHSGDANHEQEVFEVEADSTHKCAQDSIEKCCDHKHNHDGGEGHEH